MKNYGSNTLNDYSDIINLPHHVSSTRPQMSMSGRTAQFSPFAALTGYDAAIEETRRQTDYFIELDESYKEKLNEKLKWMAEHIKEQPRVTITYFQPDNKKEGGRYVSITESVKKVDEYEMSVVLLNGMKILIKFIYEIYIK